ncbi:MAG: hypothetical protein K1X83_15670 [Oligoflexia bacterium]|nr:hypothetical protein [Oligoflexia bacterium]
MELGVRYELENLNSLVGRDFSYEKVRANLQDVTPADLISLVGARCAEHLRTERFDDAEAATLTPLYRDRQSTGYKNNYECVERTDRKMSFADFMRGVRQVRHTVSHPAEVEVDGGTVTPTAQFVLRYDPACGHELSAIFGRFRRAADSNGLTQVEKFWNHGPQVGLTFPSHGWPAVARDKLDLDLSRCIHEASTEYAADGARAARAVIESWRRSYFDSSSRGLVGEAVFKDTKSPPLQQKSPKFSLQDEAWSPVLRCMEQMRARRYSVNEYSPDPTQGVARSVRISTGRTPWELRHAEILLHKNSLDVELRITSDLGASISGRFTVDYDSITSPAASAVRLLEKFIEEPKQFADRRFLRGEGLQLGQIRPVEQPHAWNEALLGVERCYRTFLTRFPLGSMVDICNAPILVQERSELRLRFTFGERYGCDFIFPRDSRIPRIDLWSVNAHFGRSEALTFTRKAEILRDLPPEFYASFFSAVARDAPLPPQLLREMDLYNILQDNQYVGRDNLTNWERAFNVFTRIFGLNR